MTDPYLFFWGVTAPAQAIMPETTCRQIRAKPQKENAAPKGRIKSEWIAELFVQMLMIIISSSIAAVLTAGLCWLVPTLPVLPGSKPAPCSVQLTQPQYPHH